MSAEENIALVKRVIDAFNQGNLEILDEVCSPAFVYHGPPNTECEREVLKAGGSLVYAAFPDIKTTLEDIFSTEDKVAYRISIQGTHLGALYGVPPTGKRMQWTAILIDHFAGGKVVEEWEWADFLGWLQQLGLISEAIGTGG